MAFGWRDGVSCLRRLWKRCAEHGERFFGWGAELNESYVVEGFSLIEDSRLVEIADTVEHVADMLSGEAGGEGFRKRAEDYEAALRHVVDLLAPDVNKL